MSVPFWNWLEPVTRLPRSLRDGGRSVPWEIYPEFVEPCLQPFPEGFFWALVAAQWYFMRHQPDTLCSRHEWLVVSETAL